MKTTLWLGVLTLFAACTLQAQVVNDRYNEVTGTSEIEIVRDKIHYLIEIREYFEVPCKCGLNCRLNGLSYCCVDVWRYDRNYTFMAEFCLSESKVAGKYK